MAQLGTQLASRAFWKKTVSGLAWLVIWMMMSYKQDNFRQQFITLKLLLQGASEVLAEEVLATIRGTIATLLNERFVHFQFVIHWCYPSTPACTEQHIGNLGWKLWSPLTVYHWRPSQPIKTLVGQLPATVLPVLCVAGCH